MTYIASDKTGTLTMNQMTVESVVYNQTKFKCNQNTVAIDNSRLAADYTDYTCKALVRCATVCNTSEYIDSVGDDGRKIPFHLG